MIERPMLFNSEMVRAILLGGKTQTRRLVKPQPDSVHNGFPYWNIGGYRTSWCRSDADGGPLVPHNPLLCPHGKPGDRLWVRETVRADELSNGLDGVRYLADGVFIPIKNNQQAADNWVILNSYRGKRGAKVPSIHMPRWCSRMTLEITGVRVERLQAISEADAIAEGIGRFKGSLFFDVMGKRGVFHKSARDAYAALIDDINGPGTWASNPLVWVIDYKIIEVRR